MDAEAGSAGLQSLCLPGEEPLTGSTTLRWLQHAAALVAGGNAGLALGSLLAGYDRGAIALHASLAACLYCLAILPAPAAEGGI